MRHIATSLNWESLLIAAQAVGMDGFPTSFSNELLADEDFLIALHRLILDIHITEGFLICPESGRRFRITNGIPSMM
jgi:multifunctional methyltransferase subunit TRM112